MQWLILTAVFITGLPAIQSVALNAQDCPAPIPVSVQNITTESAEVNWFLPGQADSFEISYRILPGDFPAEPQVSGILDNSTTLTELQPGGLYEYRIRAVCEGVKSGWSQNRRFTTHLSNPTSCQVYLPIGDNNCNSGGNVFKISVEGYDGLQIGLDVFLSEVRLIVPHTWPADLRMFLRNPAGREIALSTDNGIGGDNYGDPDSEDCQISAIFSDGACTPIQAASPPFTGAFIPEEPLAELHDSSAVNGIWELFVCDKAPGDVGALHYLELVFETAYCPAPLIQQISAVTDHSISLDFSSAPDCDSVFIAIGPQGFVHTGPGDSLQTADTTLLVPCLVQNEYTIENLSPGTTYDLYLYSLCNETVSLPSCPATFTTLCANPTLRSEFTEEETCPLVCNIACPLIGYWQNQIDQDAHWLVHSGPTPAPGSGPESAFSGSGNYIYYNTAGLQCQHPANATLESACTDIESSGGDCDMAFRYHMWGVHVGRLDLMLSVDGGFQWDTLWTQMGPAEDAWLEARIDLSEYNGTTGRFRFVATGGNGPIGDIALDEIVLFNSSVADSSEMIYFVDNDGDGYGQDGTGTFFCTREIPEGWADQDGDCDDDNPDINPGAEVIPCNLIDENCTGLEDDQPADNPMNEELTNIVNQSCPGASDGEIEIEVSGGIPPYSIQWNNGDTGTHLLQLEAGIYYATISDSTGCLYRTDFFEIATDQSMSFTFTEVVRPTCSSFEDGSLRILTGGGTPPLKYHWNTGDTTDQLKGLAEGHYQVTVTDQSACEFVSPEFHLRALNPFSINVVEKTKPSCHGRTDGSLRIQINGGSPPFDIQWDSGQTQNLLTNIGSGYYSVSITDSLGCEVSLDSIYLEEPDLLKVEFSSIDPPICPGRSSGRILTQVSGGTFPYTFFWQRGNQTYTTSDLINVQAGDYFFKVTDQNGCTFEANILLPGPEAFATEVTEKQNVICGIRNDGSIDVSVTGGASPYQIFWNSGAVDTLTLDSLASGYYRFTLTDQAGCKYTSSDYHIGNNQIPIDVEINVLDSVSCHGSEDATLEAAISSPFGPYRYNWGHLPLYERNNNRDTLTNLGANVYSLHVQDATLCSGTSQNTLIPDPPELIVTEARTFPPSCSGDTDGAIEIHTLGGTHPLYYNWSHGDSLRIADSLEAGIYSVTVTDRNGCIRERHNIQLNNPPSFAAELNSTHDDGSGNGIIEFTFSGGIPPYELLWSPSEGELGEGKITGLPHGDYEVVIMDHNGCVLTDSISVELINHTVNLHSGALHVFPNPANDAVYLSLEDVDLQGESAKVSLRDASGREARSFSLKLSSATPSALDLKNLPAGSYLLTVYLEGKGVWSKWIVVR